MLSMRLVTAGGAVLDIDRLHPHFDHAAVSMGLLGVVTRVWFRVGPSYDVFGTQVTRATRSSGVSIPMNTVSNPACAIISRSASSSA